MGLEDLKQITAKLKQPRLKGVLLDFSDGDDCGAIEVGDSTLVQSVDVIPPVVDDPYTYGQIAAANALSDIFAKGARAVSALSILAWDQEHVGVASVQALMQGALDKLNECSCALLGGHSLSDVEQKFGLSVTGLVEKSLWPKRGARVGDVLILTKPLGSGVLTTALKRGLLQEAPEAIESMACLNLKAMQVLQNFSVHACTDITGFGLVGHLAEMLSPEISFEINSAQVPLLQGALELAKEGVYPGGSVASKKALQDCVLNQTSLPDILFYDAQTSGGLLVAMDTKEGVECVKRLQNEGVRAKIIGRCVPPRERQIALL
ncbi:selenide, water dikinase SelD [Helicobacter heilmannii]|uniref:Selenide,water dikinase @ selenocysteine-containing n=1 Tax=Helicobacter heilmannii TaxID=35817 RepID=A0A0K2Y549_HELHE|nr:selenide, water dikinase SelD [Helicobacter heilmannii]CCM12105.1 Selenide,water dikinase [Helicobacter heilmannii ASB1.4]CRI34266.1 Selenide,water dikinase @ selenocysteine-containing [Helicobacter heilmannii]